MTDAILLFLAAFVAAAVSGMAGFGGALLLLPLLVASVGPTQAVPLLTVAQLVGNLSRVAFGFQSIRWRPVGLFLSGALPGALAGAQAFVTLPKDWVVRGIGLAILCFVGLRAWKPRQFTPGPGALMLAGAVVGYLSGLVGSAGPLGATVFLSLGLPPVAYVASEAVTALAMHGVKTLVYQRHIALDAAFWGLAASMALAMVAGSWVGKRLIMKLPVRLFERAVGALLVVVASSMLAYG